MTYKGTVRNGAIVLESAANLPEGSAVRISLESSEGSSVEDQGIDKLEIWQALESLPDDAQLEDFIDRVYLFYKIEKGVKQLDSGQGISHEEARKQFSEWLE